MTDKIQINCPICGHTQREFVTNLSSNIKVLGDFFPETSSEMVCCNKCGCVYVDLKATQNQFNKYYNSPFAKTISYYKNFGIDETNEYFANIHSIFQEYVNFDSKILDLGSGVGEFSKYLLDLGYKNVVSVDPSEYCKNESKNIGLNTLSLDTFNIKKDFGNEKFDLIILSHVLEHILDFKTAIENAKFLLKENGILYIEVPDAKRYSDVDFPSYFFFTYEHLSHYTEETFINIANSYGFDLLKVKPYLKARKYYVIGGVFKNDEKFENIIYTDEVKKGILKYIKYSKNKLNNLILSLENSYEKLILWGIGASTAQLLTNTFDKCNVTGLIDRNESRQGLNFKIGGKILSVQSPETIVDNSATIVVLPVMYKDSIISQIKQMGFTNKIIALKE